MNLESRVNKLERNAGGGVRFVMDIPPKMTREEWMEYAHARRDDPSFFTVMLDGKTTDGGGLYELNQQS
jgi:hypothetical protein